MKGNSEVVQHLNKLLANEQSAFNQYLLHSQLLKSWGIEKLAKTEREEAMEEVGHAEQLDHPIGLRARVIAFEAVESRQVDELIEHAHLRVEAALLGQVAENGGRRARAAQRRRGRGAQARPAA